MTLKELLEACKGSEYVILSLPPPPSRGYTKRLFDGYGPRGEVLCVQQSGRSTVRFQSTAVIRAVKREQRRNRDP